MIMIGDQLETDIKGAFNFGIDSVLIGTGITKISELSFENKIKLVTIMIFCFWIIYRHHDWIFDVVCEMRYLQTEEFQHLCPSLRI